MAGLLAGAICDIPDDPFDPTGDLRPQQLPYFPRLLSILSIRDRIDKYQR